MLTVTVAGVSDIPSNRRRAGTSFLHGDIEDPNDRAPAHYVQEDRMKTFH